MFQNDNWWCRQFVEGAKEIALKYDLFCVTREIEDFDKADILHDDQNEAYDMSLDLLEYVELGRAWLTKQTLPFTLG